MNITKRFIYIALASIVLTGLLSLLINPLISLLIINVLLIALLLSDHIMSHRHIDIRVERTGKDKLSIDEKEKICFEVYNRGDYMAELTLIDEVPDYHFKVSNPYMQLMLPSGEKARAEYELLPLKRGAFEFGDVHLKIKGRLGLYYEYIKTPLKREYKVYPNLRALKKYRMSVYKNTMERQERKTAKLRNQGTAFESLREYVTGDEYRKINWAASARSDKPIVNQYEPEKNQRIYALIDAGRPMSYTLRGECKLDKAIDTALILSDMVSRNGDMSGLLCFNEKIMDMVMPGKGSGHMDKLMEALYHIESNNATSNYEDAFLYFRGKERRKSIIFLFTDFDSYGEADIIAKAAACVERQHILVVVLMRNVDLEKMANKKAMTEEEIFHKAVAMDLLEERKQAISRLNHKNVMCIEVKPEQLEMSVISKYIEIKNKLGI